MANTSDEDALARAMANTRYYSECNMADERYEAMRQPARLPHEVNNLPPLAESSVGGGKTVVHSQAESPLYASPVLG